MEGTTLPPFRAHTATWDRTSRGGFLPEALSSPAALEFRLRCLDSGGLSVGWVGGRSGVGERGGWSSGGSSEVRPAGGHRGLLQSCHTALARLTCCALSSCGGHGLKGSRKGGQPDRREPGPKEGRGSLVLNGSHGQRGSWLRWVLLGRGEWGARRDPGRGSCIGPAVDIRRVTEPHARSR